MASELVRSVWCDVHAVDTDEKVPAAPEGQDVVVRVGNLSGTLDLCAACITNHVVPLAEFVERYARPEPIVAKAEPGKRLTCPECGAAYSYGSSLKSHMLNVHKMAQSASTKAPMGGAPGVCPHCNMRTKNQAGLAIHIKNSHPEYWKGPKTKA